jgi:hypothetical protein
MARSDKVRLIVGVRVGWLLFAFLNSLALAV